MTKFAHVAMAPKLIDLTAGMQMPQQANTRVREGRSGKSKAKDEFNALTNEEMALRMEDTKLENMTQALGQQVQRLYDEGKDKEALELSVRGMNAIKLNVVKNNVLKNEADRRKEQFVKQANAIDQDNLNRTYMHRTENGTYMPIIDPRTHRALTNAEMAEYGQKGLTVKVVNIPTKEKDKNGNEITVDTPTAILASTVSYNNDGSLNLESSNIAFDKYVDWKKKFDDVFKSKQQYETSSYDKSNLEQGGNEYLVKRTHASDKRNIQNAFRAMFANEKGQIDVSKMLSQMSEQERMSMYQDYESSIDKKKGYTLAGFAQRRMLELSGSAVDTTKDEVSYTQVSNGDGESGGNGDGYSEWDQRAANLYPVDNVGSQELQYHNGKPVMPFRFFNGAVDPSKTMSVFDHADNNTAKASFIKNTGSYDAYEKNDPRSFTAPQAIGNAIANAIKGDIPIKNKVYVLNGSNPRSFYGKGVNPFYSHAIGWSTIKYPINEKNKNSMEDNPIKTGFTIGGDADSKRIAKIWTVGGNEIDEAAIRREMDSYMKGKRMAFVDPTATSADWISGNDKHAVEHGTIILPRKAAGAAYKHFQLETTMDGSRMVTKPIFNFDGSVTDDGERSGAYSGSIKGYIEKKHGVVLNKLDLSDIKDLDESNKIRITNTISTLRKAGYSSVDEKISAVDAVVPFLSKQYGVNIGGGETTKYKSETDKTSENRRLTTGNFIPQ